MSGTTGTPDSHARRTHSHRGSHTSAAAYYCPQCLHTVPVETLRRQRYQQRGIASTLLVCPACQLVLEAIADAA